MLAWLLAVAGSLHNFAICQGLNCLAGFHRYRGQWFAHLRSQSATRVPSLLKLAIVLSFLPFGSSLSFPADDLSLSFRVGTVQSQFCNDCHVREFAPFYASRIGEATHPGPHDPANSRCVLAISNPTSIVSKASTYEALIDEHKIDVITASETAATLPAQRIFAATMKKSGFKTVWSPPVAEKISRTDGELSLRGQASGVAVCSRYHVRHVPDTIPTDLVATCRILHTIVTAHQLQFQLITLYGLAASGTQQQNRTLLHTAVQAAQKLPLPYMIAGGLNCDPQKILGIEYLQAHKLVDLTQLHVNYIGLKIPPTCR